MSRAVRAPRTLTAAVAIAGLGFAGCGTADRERDAAQVAESFYAALERSDGEAACAALNEQVAAKLERDEEEPCDEAILTLELPRGGRAERTRVYITSATVALAEGGVTFLDEGTDGWKVSAAGCAPTAPQLPYDCELEG